MIDLWLIYAACAILVLILAVCGISEFNYRYAVMSAVFAAILGLLYPAILSMTSHPTPVWMMLTRPNVPKAKVHGYFLEQGKSIMVLLSAPELGPYPRWFKFPWTRSLAEEIDQIERKRKRDGANQEGTAQEEEVEMILPFDRSLETRKDKIIREIPIPKMMPDKPAGRAPDEYKRKPPTET